jgi:hypothetical protein
MHARWSPTLEGHANRRQVLPDDRSSRAFWMLDLETVTTRTLTTAFSSGGRTAPCTFVVRSFGTTRAKTIVCSNVCSRAWNIHANARVTRRAATLRLAFQRRVGCLGEGRGNGGGDFAGASPQGAPARRQWEGAPSLQENKKYRSPPWSSRWSTCARRRSRRVFTSRPFTKYDRSIRA